MDIASLLIAGRLLKPESSDVLIGYLEAVHTERVRYLASLGPDDLAGGVLVATSRVCQGPGNTV